MVGRVAGVGGFNLDWHQCVGGVGGDTPATLGCGRHQGLGEGSSARGGRHEQHGCVGGSHGGRRTEWAAWCCSEVTPTPGSVEQTNKQQR